MMIKLTSVCDQSQLIGAQTWPRAEQAQGRFITAEAQRRWSHLRSACEVPLR